MQMQDKKQNKAEITYLEAKKKKKKKSKKRYRLIFRGFEVREKVRLMVSTP